MNLMKPDSLSLLSCLFTKCMRLFKQHRKSGRNINIGIKLKRMGIAEIGFMMDKYLPIRLFQANPVYAGLVEAMDDAVGHVLNALHELGLDDNTIVIFTSDHGGVSSGDAFATSNFPFRQGKGSTFEGGLRVPFFVKVPVLTFPNSASEVPAASADFSKRYSKLQ